MFELLQRRRVKASREQIWQVITDTADYPQWNPFVVGCDSSFEVGSAIVMQVKLLGPWPLRQRETIRRNIAGRELEYGIHIPLLLSSSRQHRLTAVGEQACCYDSVFTLRGILAPLVGLLLGPILRRGFEGMTEGLVTRAEKLAISGE